MAHARSAAALLAVLVIACERKEQAPPAPAQEQPRAAAYAAPEKPFRFPAAERVVAIGDVHGDLSALRQALRLAGALGAGDDWIGGKLVVVQTGDQLDRGDDELQILELLQKLMVDARAQGGALHTLNGNHETMNVLRDFRYVTAAGFLQFADVQPTPKNAAAVQRFVPRARGRAAAFLPGGPWATRMAARNIVAVVGDTVFVHGAVLPGHIAYGIGRINDEASRWMRGEASQAPSFIEASDGPVWSRAYSDSALDAPVCEMLQQALQELKAKRMVVGHTVQRDGISSGCNERVFRIDVGLSRYYGDGPIQVLEITGRGTRILSAARENADRRALEQPPNLP